VAPIHALLVNDRGGTPLLRAARQIQIGTDMRFEQIPLYLQFLGFGKVTSDELRAVAMLA
jgi:shikimate dehydrogenase